MGTLINPDYRFLNRTCPVCGKNIGSYNYALVNGEKVHLSCRRKML